MTGDPPEREWRIEEAGPLKYLRSGEAIHGAQYTDERRDLPVPYYPSPGPVDDLFAVADRLGDEQRAAAVGVVGLGTGGLAARARTGQRLVFYECDPEVVEIARREFSYLSGSDGEVEIVVAEGREALAASGETFGLLVLDAFVGDAVPAHFLTREAMRVYRERVAAGGAVAFHASNKIVDLRPLVGNVARAGGLQAWSRTHDPRDDSRFRDLFFQKTRWVVVAEPGGLAAELLSGSSDWDPQPPDPDYPVLSDEEASDLGVVR